MNLQISICKYPGHHLLIAFGFLMILLKQRILEILFLNHIHPWPPSHSLPCMRSQAGGLHNLQCYYHIWKHDCGLSDVRVNSNIEVWWYSQWIDNEETESTTRIQPTLLLYVNRGIITYDSLPQRSYWWEYLITASAYYILHLHRKP